MNFPQNRPDSLTHWNFGTRRPEKKQRKGVNFSSIFFWPEQNLLPTKSRNAFGGWQVSPSYWPSLWRNDCFRLLKFLVRSTTKATILTCQHCGGRLSLHLWRVRGVFSFFLGGNGKQVGLCGSFLVEQQVDRSRIKPWNFHTQLAVPNGRGEHPQSFLRGPWFQ